MVWAPAGDPAADEQRRVYQAAATGMSERQIVLAEALDEGERSKQIRSKVSTDVMRVQVFLIGKDGHAALSSDKPLSADDLFARVDAMHMRQDEMRRERLVRSPSMAFRIGIISDTDGLLWPEAARRLPGADHVLHAGDIGRPDVVRELRNVAWTSIRPSPVCTWSFPIIGMCRRSISSAGCSS